jgi:hypothetical protein
MRGATKNMKRFISGAAMLIALTPVAPAVAHHSISMFDNATVLKMHGTVQKFEWSNPHIHLWFLADPEKAGVQPTQWVLEAGSPGSQVRRGWDRHVLNPGDKVTITLNPLKDGRHAGLLQQVFGADGKPLAHKSRSETERPGLE